MHTRRKQRYELKLYVSGYDDEGPRNGPALVATGTSGVRAAQDLRREDKDT